MRIYDSEERALNYIATLAINAENRQYLKRETYILIDGEYVLVETIYIHEEVE